MTFSQYSVVHSSCLESSACEVIPQNVQIVVVKINFDDNKELAKTFGVKVCSRSPTGSRCLDAGHLYLADPLHDTVIQKGDCLIAESTLQAGIINYQLL